jgi:hypothetical protein
MKPAARQLAAELQTVVSGNRGRCGNGDLSSYRDGRQFFQES